MGEVVLGEGPAAGQGLGTGHPAGGWDHVGFGQAQHQLWFGPGPPGRGLEVHCGAFDHERAAPTAQPDRQLGGVGVQDGDGRPGPADVQGEPYVPAGDHGDVVRRPAEVPHEPLQAGDRGQHGQPDAHRAELADHTEVRRVTIGQHHGLGAHQ
ncbi:hypothetical protein GCM10029964_043300 [Kibdelosporangium lantanae]